MMKRHSRRLLAVVAAFVVLSACGGDDRREQTNQVNDAMTEIIRDRAGND